MEKLIKASHTLVVVLIAFVLWWLAALSIHSTSFVFSEDRYNAFDAPFKHGVLFVLLILLCTLYTWCRKCLMDRIGAEGCERIAKVLKICVYCGLSVLLLWFVIATQLIPIEDQRMICDAAVELKQSNFRLFAENNYMDMYGRYHSAMILFMEFFFAIFGDSNYLAFQVLNAIFMVLAIPVGIRIFYRRVDDGTLARRGRLLSTVALSLFFPWLLFASYVYGTPIGFFLALKTIDEYDLYGEDAHTLHLILMILCGCAGLIMRRNFGIYFIALTLYAVLDYIRKKNARALVGVLAIWVLFAGVQTASIRIIENRVGKPLAESIPTNAFFLMGLSETDEGMPVGFNGYGERLFKENGYDREAMEKQASWDLQERLDEFKESPEKFLSFIAKKIAIQWNEPTFEGIHVNTRHIDHKTAMPTILRDLFKPYRHNWFFVMANLAHSAILLGALAWFVMRGPRAAWHELLFAICMLGCFLLHLIWESGSRYSVTFFYMLIPYAVEAYLEMGEGLLCVIDNMRTKPAASAGFFTDRSARSRLIVGGVLFVLLILSGSTKMLFALGDETEIYNEKLAEFAQIQDRQKPTVANGRYYLYSVASPDLHMEAVSDEERDFMPSLSADTLDRNSMVTVFHDYEFDLLRIGDCQWVLSVETGEDGSDMLTLDGDRCVWKIEPAGTDSYYIRMEDYYLTENEGALVVTQGAAGASSCWRLVDW